MPSHTVSFIMQCNPAWQEKKKKGEPLKDGFEGNSEK